MTGGKSLIKDLPADTTGRGKNREFHFTSNE
jgi:hypothetical protein